MKSEKQKSRAIVLLLLLLMAFVSSCKDDNEESPRAMVYIGSSQFTPSVLLVPKGGTVIWENDDVVAHTVTSDEGIFNSGDILPGGEPFLYNFPDTGTYNYHCEHHSAMTGTVLVQ